MRLIADENISWRLNKLLTHWEIFPANEIKPGRRLTDLTIWEFAKANKYTILNLMKIFFGTSKSVFLSAKNNMALNGKCKYPRNRLAITEPSR